VRAVLMRPQVRLPEVASSPAKRLLIRLAAAIALLLFVTLVAYVERDGYRDSAGGDVSLLDCFYYATVSITTTGYGDIAPVTDGARLTTAVLVTPARVLFLIILVGTTLEVLAERTRIAWRERLWRKTLKDHTIVCGFGTKGRAAILTLLARDHAPSQIVVVDHHPAAVEEATRSGFGVVHGDASRVAVLEEAGVRDAAAVVVAADRDDTAVLVTLTARELNPSATVVASAREQENVHALKHSGADSVILSSGAAGQLLGQAVHSPQLVSVLEDLLAVGQGLDLVECPVQQPASLAEFSKPGPVLGVVRGGRLLRFDDERVSDLKPGDRVICLTSDDDDPQPV
jgi:voltage-gated potassium channel